MIACYLPKKQSLLLPKIIIFISALHAFTLFLKPKPHTSSNVVANVRQVWVLGKLVGKYDYHHTSRSLNPIFSSVFDD